MSQNFLNWFIGKFKTNLTYNIRQVLYIVFIWTFATLFFIYLKFNDIPEDYIANVYQLQTKITKNSIYKTGIYLGLFLGIIMGFLHIFVYPYIERTQTLFINLFFRFSVFVSLFFLTYFGIYFIQGMFSNQNLLFNIYKDPFSVNIILYAFITEIIVSLIVLLRRTLGRKYFLNTLKNTYRNPKEEERVFMFLDLQDSTPIAHKMGHLNFSKFIQDCFWDLSDIVLKYDAEIYQFVGDEAVITWKVSKNFDYEKCIELYFSYRKLLEQKKEIYLNKYRVVPYFTCAIHSGKVSAAMVGDYKKEIAYHGNVLNLGARLQKTCKEQQTPVLISECFFSNLGKHWYFLTPIRLNNLKGIHSIHTAYKVEEGLKELYF